MANVRIIGIGLRERDLIASLCCVCLHCLCRCGDELVKDRRARRRSIDGARIVEDIATWLRVLDGQARFENERTIQRSVLCETESGDESGAAILIYLLANISGE